MKRERDCMSDRIRRSLAERILGGQLPPGERLVEMRIAREFRSSQAPVREALRELETMRLVESQPYRGTRVRSVGDREMAEAYAVRAVLERAAAEAAAPWLKGHAEPILASLEALHEVARAGDRDGYATRNYEFHRGIVEAAGNSVLLHTWLSLDFEARVRVKLAQEPADLVRLAALHDPIARALEAGDGATAGRLLFEHSESFMTQKPGPDRDARAVDTKVIS
jgi:DNA-binding GntR family transcriptional regulator